jgi:hypothetical protein
MSLRLLLTPKIFRFYVFYVPRISFIIYNKLLVFVTGERVRNLETARIMVDFCDRNMFKSKPFSSEEQHICCWELQNVSIAFRYTGLYYLFRQRCRPRLTRIWRDTQTFCTRVPCWENLFRYHVKQGLYSIVTNPPGNFIVDPKYCMSYVLSSNLQTENINVFLILSWFCALCW